MTVPCAKHKIMLMYHGAFKNAGFERTHPNALTREGVLGSEYNIWSDKATPEHDLLLPFIRMTAGPFDYEPGFFENSTKEFFKPNPEHVSSQGTRCHQLAMFVIYESPFQVFSGNPADATKEPEYMKFLGSIPTTWDETRVIKAKLGDFVVIARRNGKDWFVAGMTDWTPRTFELDLNFIGSGPKSITGYVDGINADRNPRDSQFKVLQLTPDELFHVELRPGGGFVLKIN